MKLNKRNSNYISDIKQIISNAKERVYSSVNSTMVQAYWLIGKRIIEEEQSGKERAEYGKQIINNVSKELTDEFGRGFSATNIRYFRQFFQLFPTESIYHLTSDELRNQNYHLTSDEFEKTVERLEDSNLDSNKGIGILQIIFTKLSWTHVRQILRVKNIEARNYYIREIAKNSWVVETLDRNIATQY